MWQSIAPILYALFVWWFGTGLVLLLDGLPRRWLVPSLIGSTAVAGAALVTLALVADQTSVGAAYLAFTCGVLVWAWMELSFLTGALTGPRRQGCVPGCGGVKHFGHAVAAIAYHELAIAVGGAAVLFATWDEPNQVGLWTYVVLWVMRQSAKLNLHFGVRNLSEEFLPPRLRYMTSYFRRRPLNLLFPLSVTAATVVAVLLVAEIAGTRTSAFDVAGLTLVTTLLVLAILEHWLLVLPLPTTALWRWSLRGAQATREDGDGPAGSLRSAAGHGDG
jgi:putative photosynthetic complex assembly protein 2